MRGIAKKIEKRLFSNRISRTFVGFSKTIFPMATTQQQAGTLYNALTSGSKIIGTVIADSDIRIDGHIEGDLQCSGKVVIGEKGHVNGTIDCQNAEIMGLVEGKVNVQQTLALRATSRMNGDVRTQTLIVEPNAQFNGTCAMGKEKSVKA